jgi:hypothetical protein
MQNIKFQLHNGVAIPKYSQKWDNLLFVLPQTEKFIHKMKSLEKSHAWAMPGKVQNQKNEGFSY